LTELLRDKPEARLVKNRYRAISHVLSSRTLWKNTIYTQVQKFAIHDLIREIVYLDRLLRKHTENYDKEVKEILSQTYQLNEVPNL
jgi:hypothetical protein